MNLKEETIQQAATLVCTAETQADAIKIFTEYQMLLHNCRFIFASSNGAIPGLSINRNFSATGVIRSLFKTDKVWLLDRTTLKEMYAQGSTTFSIDYSISLDTQALSYLEPYINDTSKRIPADLLPFFKNPVSSIDKTHSSCGIKLTTYWRTESRKRLTSHVTRPNKY